MKAFAIHQATFTLLCVLPIPNHIQLWKKLLMLAFGIIVPVSVWSGLLASIVYVSKYAHVDLVESVKTVFQIAAYANVSYMLTTAFLKQQSIIDVFKRFQDIYDSSELLSITIHESFVGICFI